ncbi:hypothetical protein EN836_31810 [Mesorhizobium sp. M1C.F.Ca.ET.193.01.1.1]|uniref:hypothetical protein n=1 Tax=unclassified Mesorhizobium TaxID=325217 RepID=UPI000FD1A7A9|nr:MULTISPECIES: hypothetical protein [unclassified Mesorhizobium]TGS91631.1 hypothetical protein EN820_52465 [bacterium M00.F.Ca.ET.177.01.1.1]TGQ49862.1 hypothetical protein EN853_31805 [Mesorhizobium sp. M1C.F.Ca.ET.210.01.1.1]TGQ64326.1 hypothetical protein EN855_031820 [Mesorhizobium sp. M1C.F.Ca.ET.212.01.1.1]TGQ98062.1 hypothetical protein EN847_31805 [Mesorhizobium sp. M1C.F.Ca.ET.204.01.1.1]TGR18286.1 hypothetical protein EN839_31805 [Mesorhizobium sp. M1C.F.Ca.ET.196.01.1.1]
MNTQNGHGASSRRHYFSHAAFPKPLHTFGRHALDFSHAAFPKPLHSFGRHALDFSHAAFPKPLRSFGRHAPAGIFSGMLIEKIASAATSAQHEACGPETQEKNNPAKWDGGK